jgi:hypothetical protein
MREEQLRQHARKIAELYGWSLKYHTHRSERSDPGWPDEVWCHERDGLVLFVEFKNEKGRLTRAQQRWIVGLRGAGMRVEVWRPDDLTSGVIAETLGPKRRGWPA